MEKPFGDFYKAARYKDGHQHYCKKCKLAHQQSPTQRQQQRDVYAANPELFIARSMAAARKAPEKARARRRKWAAKNPDKLTAAIKDWGLRHPEKLQFYSATRRVCVENALSTLTLEEWQSRLVEFNFHCAYCLLPFGDETPEIDHMLPISRGGTHTYENCIPACRSCNARKSDKTPAEFMQYLCNLNQSAVLGAGAVA